MYKLLSFNNSNQTLAEYADSDDLEQSYKKYGLDGLELIFYENDDRKIIQDKEIIGVHLPFFTNWIDLWTGNYKALQSEFTYESVCQEFYNGKDKKAIVDMLKEALDYAQNVSVKYVVFHVSNVTIPEVYSRNYSYSDEDVIDFSAELINLLLDNSNYTFDFLMENLMWAGLTLTKPEITKRLMDKVHYTRKGILLDVGHLMCTNMNLKSEGEGYEYIEKMLDIHGDLCKYIKGIHLHFSITGDLALKALQNPHELKKDFYERFAQAYEYVTSIDTHSVTTHIRAVDLIKRINPKYLTVEFCAENRASREQKLVEQLQVLI